MTNTPVDPLLGEVIDDRYDIDRRLARGGMATVYVARDRRLDRPVALKIMHPHLAESADFVARFRREARAAARLRHRHVVSVHDQGTWNGAGYLVMEHVPGPNLRQELRRRGSFPVGEALGLLDEILDGLGAAHRSGVVHRDIKPENVLLEPGIDGPTVKVTDFGLARAVTEATAASTGTVLGTVDYLAPEIITHGSADPRADVYAAGILLYELLVGEPPLRGETPIQIAYLHVHGDIPALSARVPWIPQEVDELVAALTARDPLERPQDADAARVLLRRCRAHLDEDTLARRAEVVPPAPSQDPAPASPSTEGDVHTSTDGAHHGATAALSGLHTAVLDVGGRRPVGGATGVLPVDAAGPGSSLDGLDAAGGARGTGGPDGSGAATEEEDSALVALPIGSIEDRDTLVRRRRRTRRRVVSLVLMLLTLAAAVVAWWFFLGPGAQRTIPELAGTTQTQAERALSAADLQSRTVEENSDDVPAGQVIATDPEAGAQVRRHSEVTVRLSLGVLMVTTPAVDGTDAESARTAMENAGFSDVTVDEDYSDTVPAGRVLRAEPAAGAVVDHRTPARIVVSQGPAPVAVPEVVGLPQERALAALESAGLQGEVTETRNHDSVPKGAVITQDPATATQAHRGDRVELVVSDGPVLVEVPDVVGKQRGEARRILEAAGFTVTENEVLGGFFGTVRAQDPGASDTVPRGSTITLTVV